MVTRAEAHLEWFRIWLMEWVGRQVGAARLAGRSISEITLRADEWEKVKQYLACDKACVGKMEREGRIQIQGVWLVGPA